MNDLTPPAQAVLRAIYRGATISAKTGGGQFYLVLDDGPEVVQLLSRARRVELIAALGQLDARGLVEDANHAGPLNRGQHFALTREGRKWAATLEGDEYDEEAAE